VSGKAIYEEKVRTLQQTAAAMLVPESLLSLSAAAAAELVVRLS
jgi:hypothetical protein